VNQQPSSTRDYLALWSIPGIGSIISRKLIAYSGGASQVLKLKKSELLKIPGIGPQLVDAITSSDPYRKADQELEFIAKYKIKVTSFFDADYPIRLKQCEDSPLILFSKGEWLSDDKKYISIVGTRSASIRGKDFCASFIEELKNRGHLVVIVSGMAFGIDVAAHKSALQSGLPTVAVLAHGLDTIYPVAHRNIATEMLTNGALITEFFHGTFPDKNNFIRRNRIIAGLSDATIVVESDVKGGALITADIAASYNRDVFAVPGRITDKYSSGCNKLIKTNRAALLESADDLEYVMGWQAKQVPRQSRLFVELTPDEQKIADLLKEHPELNIDTISRETGFAMAKVSALLLTMEFQGLIKCLPGKMFSLIA